MEGLLKPSSDFVFANLRFQYFGFGEESGEWRIGEVVSGFDDDCCTAFSSIYFQWDKDFLQA